MGEEHLPERAVVDERLQLLVLVVETSHEADLDQFLTELGFALHDLEGRGDVGGQRLLAHHRLAVLEAGEELLLVGRAWGGQDDGVDTRVGDRVERVADHPAAGGDPGRDLLGLLDEVIVDDGDRGALDALGDACDVVGAHHSDTQDGDAQVVASGHS